MTLQTRNIRTILANLQDTFEFNDNNYESKAIEAVGRGLGIMGLVASYEKTSKTVVVENNRFLIPCEAKSLSYISFCGMELPIINSPNFIRDCDEDIPCYETAFGELKYPYVHTSFQDGEVTVFYKQFKTDDEGFPVIPYDDLVLEALEWFVVYKLMLSGYKHHTITNWKEAYSMWNDLYPKGMNSSNFPTPMEMDRFLDMWIGFNWTDKV